MGIPSLKQHDVVNRLREACSDGSVNSRQGSLFALECLADRLGLLFEPYVITVIPALLKVINCLFYKEMKIININVNIFLVLEFQSSIRSCS